MNVKVSSILKKYRYKKTELETSIARIKAYMDVLASGTLYLLERARASRDICMSRSRMNVSPVEIEVLHKEEDRKITREIVQEWIQEENDRLWAVRLEVEQIQIALKSLTREELSIVEWKYMDNLNWYYIELSYSETFKKVLTSEALQKKSNLALNKLTKILTPFYIKFGT
jgi:hypothetical protein